MGSIGSNNTPTYTYKALEVNKDSSFVKLFNNILKENGVEVGKTEKYQNGRIKGLGGHNVIREGVTIERTSGRMYRDRKRQDIQETIIIYTNGFISKDEAQKIADTIIDSHPYKLFKTGHRIKETNIIVY